jgi:hypothetical protein
VFKGKLESAVFDIVIEIQIVTENSSISDNDYKDLVKFLSGELGVKVEAYEDFQAPYLPWLSIKPGDLKVTVHEPLPPLTEERRRELVRMQPLAR